MDVSKNLIRLVLLGFLSACGGGGGSSGSPCLAAGGCGGSSSSSSSSSGGVLANYSLALSVSAPSLQTDGSSTIKVRATVKDDKNGAVEGQVVSLAATSGTLSSSTGSTSKTGVMEVDFDSNDNKANRTVTFTATLGAGVTATSSVVVQGTSLAFGGDTAGVINKPVNVTVTLKDAANKPVSGSVSLTSSLGNALPTVTTDSTTGSANFTYVPVVAGTDVLTASAMGAVKQTVIEIGAVNFAFTGPASGSSVALGVCQPVTVSVSGFSPASVTFTSSRGTVHATNACSGAPTSVSAAVSGGVATAYVKSTSAGAATVSAEATSGITTARTSLGLKYIATTPASLTLQGSPSTVSIGASSALTAVVRDATGNPVSGQTVVFSAPNGGGQTNPNTALTDDSGVATSAFNADNTLSGKDSVTVSATVQGTSVTGTAQLTVSGLGVNVVLGTDNKVVLVESPPRYRKVYGASVTDSNGSPIKNQAVTISVLGTWFFKGKYVVVSSSGGSSSSSSSSGGSSSSSSSGGGVVTSGWARSLQDSCPAEDGNNNGVIDTGEVGDFDSDGVYEPNGAVTVRPPTGASGTQVTVTTDQSGFAEFWVEYFRNYGSWVQVELKGTTNVFGKNSVGTAVFVLPVASSELTDAQNSPSFEISPFGVQPGCNNPN